MTRRQEALLAEIINEYIELARPISSKLLEEFGFFGLRSASIRSEMNQLENFGYLVHLHTSSGRVPTDRGYRYFVDRLIDTDGYEISAGEAERIIKTLAQVRHDPREINRAVAKVLSELSDHLVIATLEQPAESYKIGLSSLLGYPEFQEFRHAFRLSHFFDDFETFFGDLERGLREIEEEMPMRIYIGRENPVTQNSEEAVIIAQYRLSTGESGYITLVGPMRMDYAKNIGLIRYTTQVLGHLN